MSHQSQIPPVVASYLRSIGLATLDVLIDPAGDVVSAGRPNHPRIAQAFKPGRGWVRYPGHKRISASWANKLRSQEGVTHLALEVAPGRVADFSVAELLRGPGMSWPLA